MEDENAKKDEEFAVPPVPPSAERTRLDKWVADSLPQFSRSRVASLINAGKLFKKGETLPSVYSSARVREGEEYVLFVPPPEPFLMKPQEMALEVLYEDEDIVVVNKPAGMIVHPGAGNPDKTLVNALLFHCKGELSGVGGVERPGVVHRIDKDTSGVLVVAKNDAAHRELAKHFKTHDIERVYYAVVWGVPCPLSGTVAANIGRSRTNRQKMTALKEGGREAVTHYKVIKELAGGAAALVECRLETGRTHQIRVHLTSIGNPLIGDAVYAENRPFKKAMGEEKRAVAEGFARQALHAAVLGFVHPRTGEVMHFEVPMPEDMAELIKKLE